MRIAMLSLNYAPEEIGIGPYSAGTAQALVEAGHRVRVIAGKPYYPQWRTYDGYRSVGYGCDREGAVEIVRCPHYVPPKPSGMKRIAHLASFAAFATPPALAAAAAFKPDIVFAVAPSLLAAPVALALGRLTGAHTWLHVQDFEIEAAFATSLMDSGSLLGRAALKFQRRVISGFDTCSTISPPMAAKLAGLGVPADGIVEFRNWAEIDSITVLDKPSAYRSQWHGLAPHIALYSGNIANKQGVGIIVEAARLLRHRKDIGFLVCGEGPQKAQLIEQAAELPNIRFETLQPRERLGELLGLASVHMLPQLADAADLVLPSKLANMLASGRPVVATADTGTALFAEVQSCGLVTPPGEAVPFAQAIERIVDQPDEAAAFGVAARRRAEERWSRRALLAGFVREAEARAASR